MSSKLTVMVLGPSRASSTIKMAVYCYMDDRALGRKVDDEDRAFLHTELCKLGRFTGVSL